MESLLPDGLKQELVTVSMDYAKSEADATALIEQVDGKITNYIHVKASKIGEDLGTALGNVIMNKLISLFIKKED
jgi:hypothetical protein